MSEVKSDDMHIVEQVVKFLCEKSERPNDEFDKLAMALGYYGDCFVNGKGYPILSGSEAIFGLMGWLTTRKKVLTLSSKHNASPAVEVIKEFCEANRLVDPRDTWQDLLVHPKNT